MTEPTALPIYVQISELLIREIMAGRLPDGARLPPEREMAKDMGISVGTLRRALEELTEKGWLDRRQGSGNYVRSDGNATGVYSFFRLELLEGGGLPTAEILSVDRLEKPEYLPKFGSAAMGHRIRRLRHVGGQPAALEEIWLDGAYADALPRDLSQSLYLFYSTELGLRIVRVEDKVGLGTVPDWGGPAFGLPPGASAGFVERVSWAQDGQRAEVSNTWFNADVVRYVARLR